MRGHSPMRWSSQETAAAFRESVERRRARFDVGLSPSGAIPSAVRGMAPSDWAWLLGPQRREMVARVRDAILARVGRLVPKFAPQLTREVSDDLGEDVSERRVYRYLRALIASGEIRRTEDGYLRAQRRWR